MAERQCSSHALRELKVWESEETEEPGHDALVSCCGHQRARVTSACSFGGISYSTELRAVH